MQAIQHPRNGWERESSGLNVADGILVQRRQSVCREAHKPSASLLIIGEHVLELRRIGIVADENGRRIGEERPLELRLRLR